jgi:hypothetical protein
VASTPPAGGFEAGTGGPGDGGRPDGRGEYGRGTRRRGGRHVVGPLILLGVGIVLLLNNLEILPWTVWRDLWPFWPVLLMLLGLEAFVTGRVAWGTLVLLIVALPIVGIVMSAGGWGSRWRESTSAAPDRLTSSLSQPLGDARSAEVRIEYGAGVIDVRPLPADLASTTLADASTYGRGTVRFETPPSGEPGRTRLRIGQREDDRDHFDPGRLDVRLNPSVPIDLRLSTGATESTIDLEALRVPNLSVETGASQTHLTLPAKGETTARIEGGAAGIDITIPQNVAARIVVGDGPSSVSIDQGRFPRQGNEYRSPNFDTATDRVTLRIEVGVSRVAVQ